jgi:low temperature requirement protein LtrA
MHILAAIILILFLVFSDDTKTKIQMALFVGGIVLWIWGLVFVMDATTDETLVSYFLWYLLATLVSVVLLIRYLIKKWNKE